MASLEWQMLVATVSLRNAAWWTMLATAVAAFATAIGAYVNNRVVNSAFQVQERQFSHDSLTRLTSLIALHNEALKAVEVALQIFDSITSPDTTDRKRDNLIERLNISLEFIIYYLNNTITNSSIVFVLLTAKKLLGLTKDEIFIADTDEHKNISPETILSICNVRKHLRDSCEDALKRLQKASLVDEPPETHT